MYRKKATKWDENLLLFCLLAFVIFLSCVKYSDYDYWWHVKRGEHILESGEIRQHDIFSYSYEGQAEFSSEWLSDVLIFASQSRGLAGGYALLVVVVCMTLLFVYKAARELPASKPSEVYAIVTALLFVYLAIRFRLFIRPYIFSYLFVIMFLWSFLRFERFKKWSELAVLPVIQLLWANMSGAAVFGPAMLGMFLVGRLSNSEGRKSKNIGIGALLWASLFLVSLVNPEGFGLYSRAWSHTADLFVSTSGEFQAMTPEMLWGYGVRYTYAYQVLVILALVFFVFMGGWRKLSHVTLFMFFLVQSFLYIRMVSFAVIVGGVYATVPLQRVFNLLPKRITKTHTNVALSVVLIVLAPTLIVFGKTYSFGIGINERNLPERALQFVEQEGIQGKMFNSFHLGGYILWRLPERKVLIDGRLHHLYDEAFYADYKAVFHDPEAWDSFESKWGFDYAILDYYQLQSGFPTHLADNPDWALVYWDNHFAVYVKRLAKFNELIGRFGYTLLKPNFNDFSYLNQYLSAADSEEQLNQIETLINREIALNRANQETRLARVYLLFNLGRLSLQEGLHEIETTLAQEPDIPMEHSAAAFFLLRLGRKEEARARNERALALDPNDPMALNLNKQLQ